MMIANRGYVRGPLQTVVIVRQMPWRLVSVRIMSPSIYHYIMLSRTCCDSKIIGAIFQISYHTTMNSRTSRVYQQKQRTI